MTGHFFISYSRLDGQEFALELADELEGGPERYRVWLDQREMRRSRQDWDDQLTEAIQTCEALLFVMSKDSVRVGSGCKDEWVWALKYKKPVIPLLMDPDAELPFRLGSRQLVDFGANSARGLAQLRSDLRWLRTPEGQLREFEVRLAEAERELPRANPLQQPRIAQEMEQLRGRIEVQRRVVADPAAVAKETDARIGAGMERERQPERPAVAAAPRAKFVNPPPMTAPPYFQDRHVETGLIGEFLRDDSLRMMSVVGRGGIGKTAMVCRLLKALEGGQLPDELGELAVDGIVYLSAVGPHSADFSRVFSDLCRLLPQEASESLRERSRDPQETPAGLMGALLEHFPAGRWVLLLDNFEEVVDPDGVGLTDSALEEALVTVLRAPQHGVKVILTTRVAPQDVLIVQPGVQRRLNLDEGLPSPFAEGVLRAMDADGSLGIRDAPDELLAQARERTRGFPRALEALVAILAADRDTTLPELLADTERLPENVVEALIGEAYNRLDALAQQVMQALAIYPGPVPPVAVDYLLRPFQPGIDSATVLRRLVNMQFVRRDVGRYYLHQVDRHYALRRVPVGEPSDRYADPLPFSQHTLRDQAAEYFQQTRTPRETWRTLDDLAPQIAEFELRCQVGDFDTAAGVLIDISGEYLQLWGHVRLARELHARVHGHLSDPSTNAANLRTLGDTYAALGEARRAIDFHEHALAVYREVGDRWGEGAALTSLGQAHAALGEPRRAIEFYEQALTIDRDIGDRLGEGVDLGSLGTTYADLGEARRAIEFYEQALTIRREVGDRRGEGTDLGNLANAHAALGEVRRAIEFYEQALSIDREVGDRSGEGTDLGNLGHAYVALGEVRRAIEFYEQALTIRREVGDRRGEGADLGSLGNAYAALGEVRRAIEFYEQSLTINREIGSRRGEGADLGGLGNAYADLGEVRRAISFYEQALTIDREIGDRLGEGADLGSLGNAYAALGEVRRAIEFYEQALTINREIGNRTGEGTDLGNLGNAHAALGEVRGAIELHEQALTINREIGNRGGEALDLINLAGAYTEAEDLPRAIQYGAQGVGIADEVGLAQGTSEGRVQLATSYLQGGEFDLARTTAQDARGYRYAPMSDNVALVLGIALARQGHVKAAQDAFRDALHAADALLAHTADAYDELDNRALALSGLALVEDSGRVREACEAFRRARAITCADGIVRRVLRLFDVLSADDKTGILAPVRPAAAGDQRRVDARS